VREGRNFVLYRQGLHSLRKSTQQLRLWTAEQTEFSMRTRDQLDASKV
jgi:hypothetical protein